MIEGKGDLSYFTVNVNIIPRGAFWGQYPGKKLASTLFGQNK